ncbi:MAG: DUF4340 domain-containing protein, partial [Myxococcales bacterium]|nr:DUF4340 domain-containing protein [Myxococcales bacterium]
MKAKILAAATVLVALAAAYFFLTEPVEHKAPGASWRFPELAAVDGLDIELDGELLSLRKADEERWVLTDPISFPANPRRVARILRWLDGSGGERAPLIIGEREASPGTLQRFGFDQESSPIRLAVFADEQQAYQIVVGQESDGTTWIRPDGEDRIYQLNQLVRASLVSELDNWRDDTVVALTDAQREHWTSVETQYGDHTLRFRRDGTEWLLQEPEGVTTDARAISEFIEELDGLAANEFGDNVSEQESGLDSPVYTVVYGFDGLPSFRVEFGTTVASPEDENIIFRYVGVSTEEAS